MFSSWANAIFGGEGRNGNEPITAKTTDRGRVDHGGMDAYAFSGMQGWRVTMEDSHMVCTDIPIHGNITTSNKTLAPGHAIFGVFDGHGGDFTADYTGSGFMDVFSRSAPLKKYANLKPSDQANVPGVSLLKQALADTFCQLDVAIRKMQNKRNETIISWAESDPHYQQNKAAGSTPRMRLERSGSTIVVVMVTPSHIVCANAGDSRAVLRRAGTVLPLSFDHKPQNVAELERINTAGGFVKSKRVDGDLAVSRGLGDFSYKSIEGLPVREQKVIPVPEFVVYPRDPSRDEFLVLACDGIWDVATNEECTDFVQNLLEEGESDLGLICEEALDTCLEKNSRDNMTIAMITFDGAQTAKGMSGNNAVWKRRTARQAKEFERSAKMVATKAAAGVGLSFGRDGVAQTAGAGPR
jgi:serine/threonine protein phosphatase PrpC